MKTNKKLINKAKKTPAGKDDTTSFKMDLPRPELSVLHRVGVVFDWTNGRMTLIRQ